MAKQAREYCPVEMLRQLRVEDMSDSQIYAARKDIFRFLSCARDYVQELRDEFRTRVLGGFHSQYCDLVESRLNSVLRPK